MVYIVYRENDPIEDRSILFKINRVLFLNSLSDSRYTISDNFKRIKVLL